ncbi:MAG: ribonuclease E/G [Lachnospira eligens]
MKVRNLSGIIIVDFINMNQRNCDILMEHLKSLAKKDIVNTTIVDITKLGLVEITRKKIGKSLSESLNKA